MPRRSLLLVALSLWPALAFAQDVVRLEVYPPEVRLDGPEASQRLIVVGVREDGSRTDMTDASVVQLGDSSLVRLDEARKVRPVRDGEGSIEVRVGSTQAKVPVHVNRATGERRVSFRHEIVPVLTKLGCNQGACHGSQHGKGGFKLSLLGFEPEADYTAIVKSAEGRRASPALPDDSLLILKPTLQVPHGGGKKLDVQSSDYELIQLWLEQGASPPDPKDPAISALWVYPAERLGGPGATQRLVVMASYSDSTVRDVTDHARFDSLNEGLATVTRDGLAQVVAKGSRRDDLMPTMPTVSSSRTGSRSGEM